MGAAPIVSFEDEPLILVDHDDNQVGQAPKARAHDGAGILHRAFSVFLFNPRGEVLLQRRSDQKRLWPLFWSNSCCSHPRVGETVEGAAVRRVKEELSLEAQLKYVYKFEYQAPFGDAGSEHELCHVFVGQAHGEVRVNANEIAETRWVKSDALAELIAQEPARYTPWFKLEWERLRRDFAGELRAVQRAS